MYTNLWVVTCLVCSVGLFTQVSSEHASADSSTGISNGNASTSNHGISKIQSFGMQMIKSLFAVFYDRIQIIVEYLMKRSIILLMDMMEFLAASDSTAVIRRPRDARPEDFYGKHSQKNSNRVASMISDLFMMPYKITFGSLRFLPVSSLFGNGVTSALKPIVASMNNPVVNTFANVTMLMANTITAKTWNFTKASVLPRLDAYVNNLKESETLPDNVVKFLTELQTLYHIFKLFGMA